ncbi:MAG: tRNA uridine-5-carboxymethylaminomethyl(34) synthesis enzyme MnmG [bacterium]|nr:tRNA uridine-5-carboxymethylaminomethyl(34) synthesis enzyme MnmG [bacterium]
MYNHFDIIIIGGGHAGCEAACAVAKLGMSALVCVVRKDRIGWMPCNPSIGGPAKGHLTREIDALGGMQAIVTDRTSIHVRWQNTIKGPAVQALRAQCDKSLFQKEWERILDTTDKITIREGIVTDLTSDGNSITGIRFEDGSSYTARAIILATGTFLCGLIFRGEVRIPAGREGEAPATKLSTSLKNLGLELARLKTGTVPRVRKDSIDFKSLEIQPPDPTHPGFSFLNLPVNDLPKYPCYITHTSPKTREIIQANLNRAALFSGDITGAGPRYCPSIEDKYRKFPDKISHPVFLEPEASSGPYADEIYLQGLSTSLPADVQDQYVRSIPGLDNAVIARYGYAIEYDFINPQTVQVWGASKKYPNLFLAGNLVGTTGYEEAAGLGLLAGINAVRYLRDEEPFILRRDQAYLGVMTDDLAVKGVTDPYRILTGRAEWRLLLRFDDADRRLTPIGRSIGLVDDERWSKYLERENQIKALTGFLENTRVKADLIQVENVGEPLTRSLSDWLKVPAVHLQDLMNDGLIESNYSRDTVMTVEAEIKYSGYLNRQMNEVKRISRAEKVKIPPDFEYEGIASISRESREKLSKIRPLTLGQASRISGVKPSDIAVLDILLARRAD